MSVIKLKKMKTDYENVKEFTEGTGNVCPDKPVAMSKEQVLFLSKMVLDEVMEFMATVCGSEESKNALKEFIDNSEDLSKGDYTEGSVEQISEQVDALVDIYYYSLNAATKVGQDMSSVFKVVHQANMNKRDPETGKFIKREDGKILKPVGWKPPNIIKEIERQMKK